MNARLFDVLHDRADVRVRSVRDGVDVDLDRALDEAVDQDGAVDRTEVVGRITDAHRAPAEHVRRADQDREADPLGKRAGLVFASRYPPVRTANSEPGEQGAEPLAILGDVHGLECGPDDAVPRGLEPAGQFQRGLAAELDRDAVRPLPFAHREHLFQPERLEVEPVRCVVVGGDRLRVAVDHHGFVAEPAEALRRVHAAVVELDSLADAVRAGAEDDDPGFFAVRRRLVGLAPGRVVVRRGGLHLSGARVDTTVRRPHAPGPPLGADLVLRGAGLRGDVRVGEPRPLDAQEVIRDQVVEPQLVELVRELDSKPGMRALSELPDLLAVELARATRLAKRLDEGSPDAHRLADRLHLRPERRVGPRELLEGKTRELDDDVVQRRFEARRGRAGEIVRNLVQGVADGELRCHLGDRVARRFRREGGRSRDARIHLDHAQLSRVTLARELDVRSTALHAYCPHHCGGRVAQLLIRMIRQRHLRRDRHRVSGVDTHRIDVLDRADDHDVVLAIAHDLELELVPAAHRLLDEHLSDRALEDAELDLAVQLVNRLDEAPTVAAEGKCRPDDGRRRQAGQLGQVGDDARVRGAQSD